MDNSTSKLLCGDAVKCLETLPAGSVNMCVTSPPYYGLRDYGVDGQIGIEQSPDEYIARLVNVFDEVYRVLADDGTLWLNIGDSYAGSGKGPMTISANGKNKDVFNMQNRIYEVPKKWSGIKPKDLIGIPWMLAFALRAHGWYLRSDIIWHKMNCLPESIKDRPTKCYEHIFLLAKAPHYYFDYKAIQEPLKEVSKARYKRGRGNGNKYATQQGISNPTKDFAHFDQQYRRKRDVWEVSTNSYKMDEHFAMFPEKLIEPCILAGSKIGGVVLDPFFGSGTTGAVAKRLGREYIGIELNERYVQKAQERIDKVIPEITAEIGTNPAVKNGGGKCCTLRKNGRQDKESATTLFLTLSSCPRQGGKDKRETRFPLREVMTKKSTTDTRTRRYIRITDEGLWQQIDNISQIEKYSKSFNLIINDALFYGLPILYKKLFGDVQDETPETYERHREQVRDDGANDEFYQIIVRLLKEIVLNETINKSMLSSIFNACKEGYNGETVSGKEFAVGGYSGTPDYLESYELKGLKNIGGKKK